MNPSAQVSKLIRTHLKAIGISGRVTSESYTSGSSVNVHLIDQPKAVVEALELHCKQYVYGKFDGMTDCYDYSNRRQEIPQTKFLFVKNEMGAALWEKYYQAFRAQYGIGGELPETYEEARNMRFEGRCVFEWVLTQSKRGE